jgi:exosortase/archaeosortase family protein
MFSIKFPEKLQPYKGVIYFVVILLLSHFFWKFTVLGDDSNTKVTFFGINISAPFIYFSNLTASLSVRILHLFGSTVELFNENVLRYAGENTGVRVVWACSGLKQAYILLCIILFYRGPFIKKLWYIPPGVFILFCYNVLRIVLITAMVKNHSEWFHFLHEYFFKYLYYGIIFLMWVIWEEKIAKPEKTISS